MSADFWAGYVSGAVGILVGNPLDLIKTRLQAGNGASHPKSSSPDAQLKRHLPWTQHFEHWTALARGAAAPILGYGALNALLFVTYNRGLAFLNTGTLEQWPENPPAWSVFTAGALGGLATFCVSAPTEVVKCRAQVSEPPLSSWDATRELWRQGGLRRLYLGGGITSVRDSVGYGFYFWSYHLSKQALTGEDESAQQQALKVLLCGGLAGVVTWASIFPLDVIKTRVQTWDLLPTSQSAPALSQEAQPLLQRRSSARPSAWQLARDAYRAEGVSVFFRGLGICSARAFIVNAVQWTIYEWMMKMLTR